MKALNFLKQLHADKLYTPAFLLLIADYCEKYEEFKKEERRKQLAERQTENPKRTWTGVVAKDRMSYYRWRKSNGLPIVGAGYVAITRPQDVGAYYFTEALVLDCALENTQYQDIIEALQIRGKRLTFNQSA